jgi:hypothetical protein
MSFRNIEFNFGKIITGMWELTLKSLYFKEFRVNPKDI